MRKLFFVIIVMIMFADADAQFYKGFGIKAGATISNQNYNFPDIKPEIDYLYRYNAGIFYDLNLTKNISAEAGLYFIKKGSANPIIETNEIGNLTGNVYHYYNVYNFISIELLGKYFYPISKIKLYGIAGPRIDFYVSQKETFNGPTPGDLQLSGYPVTNNKIFGVTLGAGLELPFKQFAFLIEGIYAPDFTNLLDNGFLRIKSYSFEIKGGIKF